NLELPGGTLTQGDKSLQVRVPGRVENTAQFAELPVALRDGHVVTIGDVAEVVDDAVEPSSYAVLNGEPVILLAVTRQSGTNAIQVADGLTAKIEAIQSELPPGYDLEVVRDESAFVRTAVHAVQEHLILGALCAIVVVLLFLRSGRSTVIASLSIPFSIIATFAVLAALDLTLNLLTLLALTLAVGIVIDDAIVVLENVVRFLEERTEDPTKATLDATKEIALAVMATTLSLVAVFLPLAFIGGIMGRFLSSFGLAMTAAVLVSLLIAFTLTPMLCSRWLTRTGDHDVHRPHPPEGGAPEMGRDEEKRRFRAWRKGETEIDLDDGWLERGYVKLLAFVMERRWVVGAAIALSLGSIFVVGPMIPGSFLPEDDESRFEITVNAPVGTSLGQTELVVERISAQIRALPEVKATVVTVGSDEGDISGRGSHQASIYVSLVPDDTRDRNQFQVQDDIREKILPAFAKSDDVEYTLAPVSAFGGSGPQSAPVQYVLRGPDLDKLDEYSGKLAEAVRAVKGVAQADTTFRDPRPEVHVEIDRARAAELGVSVQDVAMALRVLVGGTDVTTFEQAGDQFDVQLRARERDRTTTSDLDRYRVRSQTGELVQLSQVAKISEGTGPAAIERLARGRSVLVYATLLPGASTNAILKALDDEAARLQMPSTYSTTLTGQSREFKRAATSFLVAIVLSFIFMYMIIAAQFESWIHPITILASLPMTVPFALLSLLIFRQSLNIFSALGLL
ncbi:MAG: efflux RND transporter permease subunit, partial [Myxococcales bacterium]|nr:efflux RND transporter permease subunit [Myxococcales bacterium]